MGGGLTRSMASELSGRGIRVNAIVPGYIATELIDGKALFPSHDDFAPCLRLLMYNEVEIPEVHTQALNRIPQERFGTCEEVADAAIFLAANEYANNCVLNLDGGLSPT